jgi:hypothetical protein
MNYSFNYVNINAIMLIFILLQRVILKVAIAKATTTLILIDSYLIINFSVCVPLSVIICIT